ncbi:DUF47 domain-containing protein [Methanoplanus endosymbiosus]|uniref:DUF47 family protein n=1 Tax=Methanoplanus endosymbiosus TaxID=33865 RepID=A0A9E7PNR7_9EURY|nr:DUF47 family protein [Methanoplanus endosymbiosus]UUX93623.1 DUF47 family protein [Methanoplanus endosymbiosus]
MNRKNGEERYKKKKGLFGSIFPKDHDFRFMLADQADKTLEGVQTLVNWLDEKPLRDPIELEIIAGDVDKMRYNMEEILIEAFSTPFDRQDIYSLSRNMDYILNYSKETAREIYAYKVDPDPTILDMSNALLLGTKCVYEGVNSINNDGEKIREMIRRSRNAIHELEDIYITGTSELFKSDDPMDALKKREVYHHLRDAGRALRSTVDTLHTVVVGLN